MRENNFIKTLFLQNYKNFGIQQIDFNKNSKNSLNIIFSSNPAIDKTNIIRAFKIVQNIITGYSVRRVNYKDLIHFNYKNEIPSFVKFGLQFESRIYSVTLSEDKTIGCYISKEISYVKWKKKKDFIEERNASDIYTTGYKNSHIFNIVSKWLFIHNKINETDGFEINKEIKDFLSNRNNVETILRYLKFYNVDDIVYIDSYKNYFMLFSDGSLIPVNKLPIDIYKFLVILVYSFKRTGKPYNIFVVDFDYGTGCNCERIDMLNRIYKEISDINKVNFVMTGNNNCFEKIYDNGVDIIVL